MRPKLVLAGLLAGAAFVPAPASASCVVVEGVDRCVSACPSAVYREVDRETGGALPRLPLHVDCTL